MFLPVTLWVVGLHRLPPGPPARSEQALPATYPFSGRVTATEILYWTRERLATKPTDEKAPSGL